MASHAAVSLHDHAARPAAAVSKPGDKMTGRYYQVATQDNADSPAAAAAMEAAAAAEEAAAAAEEAAAAAAGNAAPELKDVEGPEPGNNQRKAVLKELEEQTVADPGNQDVWLQYALEQIDYAAVDSMHGMLCCQWCVCMWCFALSLLLLVSIVTPAVIAHICSLTVSYSGARPHCTYTKVLVISSSCGCQILLMRVSTLCCGSCTFCIQCSAIMSPLQQVSISTGQLFHGVRLRICRSEAHGLFEVRLQRPGGRPLLPLALAVVPATILPPHDCQRWPQ